MAKQRAIHGKESQTWDRDGHWERVHQRKWETESPRGGAREREGARGGGGGGRVERSREIPAHPNTLHDVRCTLHVPSSPVYGKYSSGGGG